MNRTSRRTAAWSRSSCTAVVVARSSLAPLGLSRMGSIPSCATPPAVTAARGHFLSDQPKLADCGGKLHSRGLVASDDLADARVIEADQLANLAKRETVLLGLGESLASCLPRRLAVALKLPLSCFDFFSGSVALWVCRHRGSLTTPMIERGARRAETKASREGYRSLLPSIPCRK